jgi:hypothetical protein
MSTEKNIENKNIERDKSKWWCECKSEDESGEDLYFDLLSFLLLLAFDICIISIFDIFFFRYYFLSVYFHPFIEILILFFSLFVQIKGYWIVVFFQFSVKCDFYFKYTNLSLTKETIILLHYYHSMHKSF